MTCEERDNGGRSGTSSIGAQQGDTGFRADDFAFVARLCAIGLVLSFAAILGAPDLASSIAHAFDLFSYISTGR